MLSCGIASCYCQLHCTVVYYLCYVLVLFQVIANYTELLWMISLDNLPDDYQPPSVYSMLVSKTELPNV